MSLISDIPLVQEIIGYCKSYNIQHIVISPGSRNAPLALSFANNSYFKSYSIVDERCAAFFALGIAQQLQQPVALVCTSGSALLNYYPAIAEAYYSDIPLLILSADRPKEFIDIGDGQTIRQEGVFKNHIGFEANLENTKEYTPVLSSLNGKKIEKAIQVAYAKQTPVHINIPLYEPLYNTVKKEFNISPVTFKKEKKSITTINEQFLKEWNTAEKIMILVGVLSPNSIEEKVLNQLLELPNVLLLTETTSNLHHPNLIANIDQVIADLDRTEKKEIQPVLLLTFGGLIVSKKIKALLRTYSPKVHAHISEKTAYNTFGCLTHHFKNNPNIFIEKLIESSKIKSNSTYQKRWLDYHSKLKKGHLNYLNDVSFSDLKAFQYIIDQLPKNLHLQLSNSSTIRYTQLFSLSKNVDVFCNRGTSGIDGSTSTAIGASIIQKKQTLLITGDLSFFYDSNALWNNYIPINFKIIIINNNGGGIFRILPGDKTASYFDTFLETTHQLKAEKIANMYDFEYSRAIEADIEGKLKSFFESPNRQILEILTPRQINDVVLLNYFKKVKQ